MRAQVAADFAARGAQKCKKALCRAFVKKSSLSCAALGSAATGARTRPWAAACNVPEGDAAFAQVIRRQLQRHLVAGQNADVIFTHLARRVSDQLVTVVQRNAKT